MPIKKRIEGFCEYWKKMRRDPDDDEPYDYEEYQHYRYQRTCWAAIFISIIVIVMELLLR